MNSKELMERAKEAAEASYSPYSHFKVGAALLCEDGSIITGTNVENRSFGLTNCAERSAFYTAISGGIQNFIKIAVYSPDTEDLLTPCGACRQVISEFTHGDFPVILHEKGELVEIPLKKLFPMDSLQEMKRELN